MISCKNCKHFNQEGNSWHGWCGLELPSWLLVILGPLPGTNDRFVRGDNYCSFGEKKK